MASRRDAITMTDDEVRRLLDEELIVTCATNGPRGLPHLMPLWFTAREAPDGGPRIWAWTFAKSQKVRNLERDARATLQVEAGDGEYAQLRGLMLECDVVVHRDLATVAEFGRELFRRYAPGDDPAVGAMIDKQAPKRVALEFVERHRASWDHRKLGGIY